MKLVAIRLTTIEKKRPKEMAMRGYMKLPIK
jgi:hypothetical protein